MKINQIAIIQISSQCFFKWSYSSEGVLRDHLKDGNRLIEIIETKISEKLVIGPRMS